VIRKEMTATVKLFLIICIGAILLLALSACGATNAHGHDTPQETETPEATTPDDDGIAPEDRKYINLRELPEGFDTASELQLRKDYLIYLDNLYDGYDHGNTLFNVWILWHIGTYSNCEIVTMASQMGFTQAERPEIIAGYTVTFGSGQPVYAYKDSTFLPIEDAYEAGWLTKEDIYDIGSKVDGSFLENNPAP
jgi:hypothetical protein